MKKRVAIVGAGMGGLAASLRLAQRGYHVEVFEASLKPGGLASGLQLEGLDFDAGPYILLDREGLEWSFAQLGLDLGSCLTLRRLDHAYEVGFGDGCSVSIFGDLDRTADELERQWPGSGERYKQFVQRTAGIHERIRPLLYASPRPTAAFRAGTLSDLVFLLSSLGSVLRRSKLPAPVTQALGIWTHVAAQTLDDAPSPLGLVPALIHTIGAFYPAEGIGRIPNALSEAAASAGVVFHYGAAVRRIRCSNGRTRGVESADGEYVEADAVLSNASAIATYLNLVEPPKRIREHLRRLPLQSPGVCAYLAVRKRSEGVYLRFRLSGLAKRDRELGSPSACRLLVTPSAVAPEQSRGGWWPARLVSPMPYSLAERGPEAQQDFLNDLLARDWWKDQVGEYRLLSTRVPAKWGALHNLYRESMNPVMTATFMRVGRIAHRSPWVKGLYFAGSSTHPGQWVSFCAISGILAADKICEDALK